MFECLLFFMSGCLCKCLHFCMSGCLCKCLHFCMSGFLCKCQQCLVSWYLNIYFSIFSFRRFRFSLPVTKSVKKTWIFKFFFRFFYAHPLRQLGTQYAWIKCILITYIFKYALFTGRKKTIKIYVRGNETWKNCPQMKSVVKKIFTMVP